LGGSPGSGGVVNSGGVPVSGGVPSTGGSVASGGVVGAGGSVASGGTPSLGGSPTGGASGSAGSSGSGGVSTTGGSGGSSGSSGGSPAGAGAGGKGSGGSAGSGGLAGSGGSGGSSGAGTGGTAACTAPGAVKFGANIRLNDDTGKGNQSEVTMAAGPNGLAMAGWMDERAARVCAFSVTTDGGVTWSKNVSIPNVSGQFVGDPAVAIDGAGTLYAVCQEYVDVGNTGNIRMMTSTDKGATWSAIRTVGGAPDKPWAGGGTADGTVFISWLGNPGGIKRSVDRGQTWGTTQSLGNIIHGTAIVTSTTGLVHVPYNLDSQNNQLRYLRSKDNGATWEKTRDLVADMGTFCFSCSPRQHPIVGAASDPTGKTVAITWTSRMSGGQSDDDVWLLFSKDGGDTWSKPLRVNDNTNASRQFQSWVAVDRCGRVHTVWTDLRNGNQNEVWYARSADPTQGFEPNIQVTDGHGTASSDFLGDYKGIVVQGPDVLVTWMDTRRDGGDIYFARAAGAAGP
jgi:hypothetical protein